MSETALALGIWFAIVLLACGYVVWCQPPVVGRLLCWVHKTHWQPVGGQSGQCLICGKNLPTGAEDAGDRG